MRKRTIVLLNINNTLYKFLSIFYSKKDSSYYLYQHMLDETGPLEIAEPFHLLSSSGNFPTNRLKKDIEQNGHLVHLSIHPTRLYLKKRSNHGKEEHLMAEVEPQSYKNGSRLHCIFTPAPTTHLEVYSTTKKKAGEDLIIFQWSSPQMPQISIYELENEVVAKALPPGSEVKMINSDGLHPIIALHLRVTSEPGPWRPNCGIFGRILKKDPISKSELQRIISYNNAPFDISSLPDNVIINDYKIKE